MTAQNEGRSQYGTQPISTVSACSSFSLDVSLDFNTTIGNATQMIKLSNNIKDKILKKKQLFTNWSLVHQQDADAFLGYILALFHDELSTNNIFTAQLNNLIQIALQSVIKCDKCHNIFDKDEINLRIGVNITNGINNLQKLFNIFFDPNELKGVDKYLCSICKQKTTAQKRLILTDNPHNI